MLRGLLDAEKRFPRLGIEEKREYWITSGRDSIAERHVYSPWVSHKISDPCAATFEGPFSKQTCASGEKVSALNEYRLVLQIFVRFIRPFSCTPTFSELPRIFIARKCL